jgi:hypothetical protein
VPTLPEAPVTLYGTVVAVEPVNNFETKKPDGSRVLIAAAAPGEAGGFSRVKLRQEDHQRLMLRAGQPVAWLIRHGAWAGRTQQGEVYVQFVREATSDDTQALHEHVEASSKALTAV